MRLTPTLLALVLCGCQLPVPVTPIQVLTGSWPPPGPPAVAELPYTITGDTFALPALGLSVTRASQALWAFQPTQSGVMVRYTGAAPAPEPALLVQVVALPAGTDLAAAKAADKQALEKQGATVTTTPRTLDGVAGEAWEIVQGQTTIRRLYMPLPGGVAVVQAQAATAAFAELGADFERMIGSIELPRPESDG